MIPQSFIQELLGRVDIVDVVDRHVKLKRAGANHVACCPFHNEKTPSFTVSQAKQFYHCFGCGAHGTAIGFLMEHAGLGFVDAVHELARSAGLTVPQSIEGPASRNDGQGNGIADVLLRAAQYYRAQLRSAPAAIAYLKSRGLSGAIARDFGIGYAPAGWQNLASVFSDYAGETLAAVGLVKLNDDGRRYDMFRDRIIFPIVDMRGNVVGFGGRVLGAGEPKYLNSPESPVFEKGRELYGLFQGRRAIRDAGRVVVVEGYMDVVALAQHGIGYAVATLGTATTPVHVQKLLRQADEVVFCFDGDAAGRRAAWRALEVALPQLADGKQVRYLFLPEGEDPDTFVRRHGQAEFEQQLESAQTLSRFLLEELSGRADLASAEGRAGMIHAARPLLRLMPEGALRLQVIREVAERSRSTPEEIAHLCQLGREPVAKAPVRAPVRPMAPLTHRLLNLLVSRPQLAGMIGEDQRILLDGPDMASVAELIETARQTGADTTAELLEALRGSRFMSRYQGAAGEALTDALDDSAARTTLSDILRQLEHDRVKREFEELNANGVRDERLRLLARRLDELKRLLHVGNNLRA